MRIVLDSEESKLEFREGATSRRIDLYSPESFELVSRWWLKIGWALRYSYAFTWMGRPIIQLPEDLLRIQELVLELRPDIIIETGIAHGGSLVFLATLCKAVGKGRVIGVDIEIRPHNRKALEAHCLFPYISLVEGDSTAPGVVERIRAAIGPSEAVLVILDSDHSRAHVRRELEAYSPLVTVGSYVVVADGIMSDLWDVPGGNPSWSEDNPMQAVRDFTHDHPEFVVEPLRRPFDESLQCSTPTYWPSGYLRRVAANGVPGPGRE